MLPIKLRNELISINLLVVILIIAIIFFPSNALRVVLALPFLLFLPGYVLMAALFPRREGMGALERMALSFGISVVIVPLIGMILNYSPWGIRLEPVLYSVSIFIFATSIIAWLRCRRLPEQERLGIEFQLKLPGWGSNMRDRVLSVALVVVIIVALGVLGYVIVSPKAGDKFTEFYVLDTAGEMADYPQEISVGMAGNVVLRIVNHEYQEVSYRVEIRSSGVIIKEVGLVKLEHGQNWEQEVDFIPVSVGGNQKVEFILFKGGEDKPYLLLHLWVNVREGGGPRGS